MFWVAMFPLAVITVTDSWQLLITGLIFPAGIGLFLMLLRMSNRLTRIETLMQIILFRVNLIEKDPSIAIVP